LFFFIVPSYYIIYYIYLKISTMYLFLILSLLNFYSVPLGKSLLISCWSAEFAMVHVHDFAPYISMGM